MALSSPKVALDGLPAALALSASAPASPRDTCEVSADGSVGLNWLTLGHARTPPVYARLGAPISSAQHDMLERLEVMIDHFLDCPTTPFAELGRAAEKLAILCKLSFELKSFDAVSQQDIQSFLKVVSKDVDPYGSGGKHFASPVKVPEKHETECKGGADSSAVTSCAEPEATRVPLATTITKPVVAHRIKWKLGPSFDPRPFLTDPVVQQAFQDPDVLRLPESDWPRKPRAQVHCQRSELLALAEKWDKLGACRLVPCREIRKEEAVGLFAVPKDEEFDRLIINPTVINARQRSYSNFTRTLAPGSLICLLRLEPHQDLLISSDDLCEFYYTFQVSGARARRNAIGLKLDSREVSHLQCFDKSMHGDQLYLCLNTLAMGDGLAVEIAQQSHYVLLQTLAGSMKDHEVIAYRRPIPRGPFYELLTIDDHIGLQKVDNRIPHQLQDTRDKEVFKRANLAYEQVGLVSHPGKRQRQQFSGTVLGAEVDGKAGFVSAPRSRVAMLMFITAVVVRKRRTTRRILQSLLGTWIHVCLFRRPTFAVLDKVFNEGVDRHPDEVFALSSSGVQELCMLMILGPLMQTDLRISVSPELFMMDASPSGGAICRTVLSAAAIDELWRHSEQRGYYTKLQEGAGAILRELGLEHEEFYGAASIPAETFNSDVAAVAIPKELHESVMFDCIELFSGQGNWSKCHAEAGLRVHPGIERNQTGVRYGDLSDDTTFRKLADLAYHGRVREWHAGPPCWSFGTLRRPRLRSLAMPAGFDPDDPQTREQTMLAVRTGFLLMLALLAGCYISCEQPGSSVMFMLNIFQELLRLGCKITKFPFCSYGSGFNKPSKWLHNKPWLLALESRCSCAFSKRHFVIEGSFTRAAIREFDSRCRPSCLEVYGKMPELGQSLSSFSAAYPLPLCRAMAAGSALAHREMPESSVRLQSGIPADEQHASTAEPPQLRPWHDDPDWVGDLCEGLQYKELFRYKFRGSGHINVLECRVYKSWLKHCAKRWARHRILGLLDSRVTMGAAAKGRSSSASLSRVLRTSLGYVLGGGLYPGTLHCRSAWNRADGPSRDRDVPAPSCARAKWIDDLCEGKFERFDEMLEADRWIRPVGRWIRLLLLMSGIEPNPGPGVHSGNQSYQPRGELCSFGGLSRATMGRMQTCLQKFETWLYAELGLSLDAALSSAELANLALRGYGRWLFSAGRPRYLFVYTITGVQRLRPEMRSLLSGAWHIDRMWQLEEPGQCRAVLSAAMVRAILCLGLLWGWERFVGTIALGFAGMLHPNEFVQLVRQDLVLPEDALLQQEVMYVHIRNPKTARFARRQHARIDDPSIIFLVRVIFGKMALSDRLFGASIAVFRRQWNAILDFLQIPRRQAARGATPGVLRGSGATQLYLETEDLPRIAWRGRWSRQRTLEFYIQEVAAQLFMHSLPSQSKEKIALLEKHVLTVLASLHPSSF